MTKELTKMRGILITVLVEWMILRICALTPSCSPNPRALSEAQPTLAKNRFSCKTQMAFTTSKLASSKAPKVRAIAQDTLFKKTVFKLFGFSLGFTFCQQSSPSFNRKRISKNKNVYSRIFKYSSRAPSPTGRRGFRRNLVCSGGVVLDIQFKLKRLYGSSSCSQLHVKRS